MRFLQALLPAALAGIAMAAEPVPADLLPPGTKVLVGISVRSLIDSPLLKILGGDAAKMTASFTAAGPLAGLDPARDLDSIFFASTGQGEDAPALIVVRGRFHPEQTAGAKTYKNVPVFNAPTNQKGTFAILDTGTAIAGTRKEVLAAIDRRGGASSISPAIADKVASLSASYDFWGVGEMPGGFRTSPPASKSLDSIDRFEFGASLRQDLQVHGKLHLRTPQQAQEMAMSLKMIEGMMKARTSAGGTQFDLRAEDGTLELTLLIPEAELKKALAAQKEALAGAVRSRLGVTPTEPPANPVSHTPNKPAVVETNDRGETVKVTLPGGN